MQGGPLLGARPYPRPTPGPSLSGRGDRFGGRLYTGTNLLDINSDACRGKSVLVARGGREPRPDPVLRASGSMGALRLRCVLNGRHLKEKEPHRTSGRACREGLPRFSAKVHSPKQAQCLWHSRYDPNLGEVYVMSKLNEFSDMTWERSLEAQVRTLDNAVRFLRANAENMRALVRTAARVRGFHFFTGVGKNGFVAEKVASTFNSLGLRSMFVDPVNTLHGDMDIFSPSDLLYSISKSGETEELIRFHTALRKLDFRNICLITSRARSTLSQLSRVVLEVPVSHEADHLGLAPVASSVVYMAVLQSVAVELSSSRGFTRRDFVRCHPGGSLGRTRIQ